LAKTAKNLVLEKATRMQILFLSEKHQAKTKTSKAGHLSVPLANSRRYAGKDSFKQRASLHNKHRQIPTAKITVTLCRMKKSSFYHITAPIKNY